MEVERQRRRVLIVLGILVSLFLLDQLRAPRHQLSARALLGAIHLYQATLSPRMPQLGVHCRFKPTCSHYGEGAIRKYGAAIGSAKTAWRILRCGPWTPDGTIDPP
jgi:putative membrane protein insertion efficiency factor